MSNLYGWGDNEPQIKPKDQGGDSVATFSQKVYNLFNNLFDTLNSYPWSTATQSDAGYMSATDKETLDDVATTYLPLAGGTMTGGIVSSTTYSLRKSDNAQTMTLLGGSTGNSQSGAKLGLIGSDSDSHPGGFYLQAGDSNGCKQFRGEPDGTLTWGGNDVAIVETGTWTPVLKGGTTAGTFTYDVNTAGYYVKIGKLVYFFCRIATTDYSTHPTGRVKITGLPYTSVNYNTSYALVNAIGYAGGVNSSVLKICGGFVPYNSSSIDLLAQSSDTPWQKSYAQFSSSSSTGYNIQFNSSNKTANLYATGCYECA